MMEIEIVSQKEHFFNEEQKKVKEEIMEKLLNGLSVSLKDNQKLFPDMQSFYDLIFSVLVMFNRDVLSHTLIQSGITNHGSKIMRNLFDKIHEEVVNNINLNRQ